MMVRWMAVLAAVALAAAGVYGARGDGAERRLRLPAALPADLPLPEGAVLSASRDLGARGVNLVFETDEPVAAAQGRLRSRLEAGGWRLLSEVATGTAVFASYRKEGRSVALSVSSTGGTTVVGLAYQQLASGRKGERG
jgi:hypothetical protein